MPTRTNSQRVIPLVNLTAQVLSRVHAERGRLRLQVLWDDTLPALQSLGVPCWQLRERERAQPLLLLGRQREHALETLRGLLHRRCGLHLWSGLSQQLTIQIGIQLRVEELLPRRTASRGQLPRFRLIFDHAPPPTRLRSDPRKAGQK
jgi:hypothetical protein